MFANPFVDLHANDPTLEITRQKPLKVHGTETCFIWVSWKQLLYFLFLCLIQQCFFQQGVAKEAIEASKKSQPLFEEFMAGGKFTEEMNEVFQLSIDEIAKDVSRQNKRLGGNMAVAHAVFSRRQREAVRKILGPECTFIVLNMSKDCQKKRVIARHEDSEGIDGLIGSTFGQKFS